MQRQEELICREDGVAYLSGDICASFDVVAFDLGCYEVMVVLGKLGLFDGNFKAFLGTLLIK